MYNRVNCSQKQHLVLKSYFNGNNTSNITNRECKNIYYGKVVSELHDWIEKRSCAIKHLNVSDSLFVKINGTIE